MKQGQTTINLPKQDVRRLLDVLVGFEDAQDRIEDFLIVKNKSLLKKLYRARKEHVAGKVKKLSELK